MFGGSKAKGGCGGQDWRLWIRVIEARHVMWQGVETRVAVRVGRSVHTSSTRPASSAPYFGEEFTFSLNVPLEDLLDQVITLSVQQTQKRLPFFNRVLGKTELDICTVWEQPDHQISRKWAVLNHPSTDAPAGFLLVDLALLGHGDRLRLLPHDQTGSPIEQNLLAPSWARSVRRCRARYAIRIFFADGLPLHSPYPLPTKNVIKGGNDPDLDSDLSDLSSSKSPPPSPAEKQPFIESSPKSHKTSKIKYNPSSKKSRNLKKRPNFVEAFLRKHKVTDVENQISDDSEAEESDDVADPKQVHITRGFHSCGCKARYMVRINFAGKSGTTSLLGCDHFQPAWSEEVILPEMFPPLYQRMNFQLLDTGRIIAQHRLHLNRATCDPAHQTLMGNLQSFSYGHSHSHAHSPLGGVIASYGPVSLNLSGPPLGRNPNKPTSVKNAVKGPQPRGRILIELRVLCADTHVLTGPIGSKTKKNRNDNKMEVAKINVAHLPLKNIWRTSSITLACVIWDVSMVSRARLGKRTLGFQISLGSAGDHLLWQHSSSVESNRMLRQSRLPQCPKTEPRAKVSECPYLHIPFGKTKPVLAVTAVWPWCVPDLRATNHIDRLAHLLQHELTSSGRLIERGDPGAAFKLVSAVDLVVAACASILFENEETLRRRDDESSGFAPPGLSTRAVFRVRRIEEAAHSVLRIGAEFLPPDTNSDPVDTGIERDSAERFKDLPLPTISSMYRKCYVLLGTMHDVIGELGSGLPDMTLWLLADGKRVGAITLPARSVLAARKQARRGRYCGRLYSVFLRDVVESSTWSSKSSSNCKPEEAGGSVLAKVEAVFWLGTHRTAASAVQHVLPGGSIRTKGLLPLAYNFIHEYKYECVAYVYQGRFAPGADRSGLNDPFVRIVFGPHCAQTEVSEASLSPRWKRFLRLPAVSICGDPASIQNNPPMVVIEAWDKDAWSNEFLGRVLVKPRVRLANETSMDSKRKVSFHILPRDDSMAVDNASSLGEKTSNYEDQNNDFNGHSLNLRWLPMSVGNTRTGDILAAVELVQISEDIPSVATSETPGEKSLSEKSAKKIRKGKASVPDFTLLSKEVAPQNSTYRLEILFWGLRDLPKPLARPPDHHFVVFEIAGTIFKSSRLDPKESLNFPDCYVAQLLELPSLPNLLPAVHIKLLRRQVALFNREYVATNVIPSLSMFLWDFENAPKFYNGSSDANIFPALRVLDSEHDLQQLNSIEDTESNTSLPLHPEDMGRDQNTEKSTRKNQRVQTNQGSFIEESPPRRSYTTVNSWRRIYEEGTFLPTDFAEETLLSIQVAPDSSVDVQRQPATGPPRNNFEPEVDWWSRYYASLDQTVETSSEDDIECGINPICRRVTLKKWNPRKDSESLLDDDLLLEIYPDALEAQSEFENFQDFLFNIELNRGKAAFPEDSELPTEEGRSARAAAAAVAASLASHWSAGQVVATLKTCIRLEQLTPGFEPDAQGRLWKLADNGSQKVIVRVYVIRAHALHGRLRHGRANPYLSVTFGRHNYDGRNLRQLGVLDPIFGKCVEFEGEFPLDHRLTVRVMGGLGGSHTLLGHTIIDLENRFYSRHLGGCGLPQRYEPHGPNAWRDSRKPIDVLTILCRAHDLPDPVVDIPNATLTVGDYVFQVPDAALRSPDPRVRTEEIALNGLLSWHTFPGVGRPLVPAHVETRSLIHPDHPGVEQGKLEMWVDVIPVGSDGLASTITTTLIVPPRVDIEPPIPRSCELRVIVIQAKNVVVTERNILSHETASDVYLAGWVGGIDELQKTDVHFRSVDGVALFNWRFVFVFDYVSAEGRIVIGDRRIPPRLHIALMDYDTFTKDDILGTLTLDLKKFQRPHESSKTSENALEVVDLFRVGHARGWWPISPAEAAAVKGRSEAGKVELDIQLLSLEDALQDPVGLGRNPPQPLDPPKRPLDSISMLRHPILGFYHIVWKKNRLRIIVTLLILMAVAGFVAGVYSLPKYLVRRLFGM